jgi:ribosome-associated translation inhibitor RaiA
MPDMHENGSGESRLDRMERMMAELAEGHVRFDDEHKRLLTAQVVLTDRVDKLAVTLDTAIKELSASQRHTDERLNALIAVVDDIVRRRPPQ